MTVLTRFEPFREFSPPQDRINPACSANPTVGRGPTRASTTSSFAPAVDVYADEHQVTLKILF